MLTSLWVQNEVKLLLELLPKYTAHVEKHPHTLLVKFFGLYRVVPESGSKVGQARAIQHPIAPFEGGPLGCLVEAPEDPPPPPPPPPAPGGC